MDLKIYSNILDVIKDKTEKFDPNRNLTLTEQRDNQHSYDVRGLSTSSNKPVVITNVSERQSKLQHAPTQNEVSPDVANLFCANHHLEICDIILKPYKLSTEKLASSIY